MQSTKNYSDKLQKLRKALADSDTVVIGAGAGLSTSAGFVYSGERLTKYFSDFTALYGFSDMYSGGFYPFPTTEQFWGYWSRYIWINRYMHAPKPVYETLLSLVREKEYFVITTNVDHCFQKAGFDKKRLFYTQGDYGLFQCSVPCHQKTYDNENLVRQMLLSQGIEINDQNEPVLPSDTQLKTEISSDLLPVCPVCGKPMTMNLRSDEKFVEDEGWHRAAKRYENFLRTRGGKVVFLELGVGYNTPAIIKYPFWNLTAHNPQASYVCINFGDAVCPKEIDHQAILLDGDIGRILAEI